MKKRQREKEIKKKHKTTITKKKTKITNHQTTQLKNFKSIKNNIDIIK